ncbi:MAG TPA: PaaI family thioesterase [Thermomicrobiales bacterium]|nr:PaaI family thioesterase [Thermomicrobiales bacterium]
MPPSPLPRHKTVEALNDVSAGTLVGLIGLEIVEVDGPRVRSRLELRDELLAPNGFLHAGTVITLADTTAGYGAWANLPEAASGFTTIELKANFVGTALAGTLTCEAELRHGGRSTQVWDATVRAEATGKTIALFRCTQLILYRVGPA